MRTSMAMSMLQCAAPGGMAIAVVRDLGLSQASTGGPAGSFRRRGASLPRAVPGSVPGDPHFLLGHFTVHDTERPELGPIRLPGGNQDVVGPGLAGVGDVGARRVGLGGGVGVVD